VTAAAGTVETVTLPERCPGCGAAWAMPDAPACPRCALERAEAAALLAAACRTYNAARSAAQAGRFAEARRLLGDAASGGLTPEAHPAAARLSALCDAALGAAPVPPAIAESYADARCAARAGDYAGALGRLAPALRAGETPAPLPIAKLALLCAAGAAADAPRAEAARAKAVALLPGDPDLSAWHFYAGPAPAAPVRPARPARRRRPPPGVALRPVRPPRPVATAPAAPSPPADDVRALRRLAAAAGGGALVAAAVAGVALSVALSSLSARRPQGAALTPAAAATPRPAPSPSPPVAVASPAPRPAATPPLLPAPLAREQYESRRAADERTARRWFNEADRALRAGDPKTALRLAEAVHALAPDSYLGDEALLLAARAADTMGYRDAPARWARLAREYPRSSYAALARQRGAGSGTGGSERAQKK
jgi:hypothetical protein